MLLAAFFWMPFFLLGFRAGPTGSAGPAAAPAAFSQAHSSLGVARNSGVGRGRQYSGPSLAVSGHLRYTLAAAGLVVAA